jgi:hypothetical protein
MSELVDPLVNLDFYQITSRGTRMSDEVKEFSALSCDEHRASRSHSDQLEQRLSSVGS